MDPHLKVDLLLQMLCGETTRDDACRDHGLDGCELDRWMAAFLEGGRRALDVQRAHPSDASPAAHDLRTLVDTIPTLVWQTDALGSAEFLNRLWLDYTGMSAEEARGSGWTRALHPDEIERVVEEWRFIVASGEPGALEARLRRRDGTFRWFLFRAVPSRDAEGKLTRWYGTTTDVEDLKRAEAARRESEERFRLIVDCLPGLVATMSVEGEVEHVNQRILDYGGTALQGLRDWRPFLHPEDLPRVAVAWRQAVETGDPYDIEHRARGAGGVYRWFHVRGLPLRDADGRILRWYILFADIEDRKRVERTLAESERRLRLLFESIPGMIAVNAADGSLEYVNRPLLDFVGKDLAFLADLGWGRILHPEDADATLQEWKRCFAAGEPLDVTFRIRRADGVYRWFQARSEPRVDAHGRIAGWYALLWDIEDRKQAESAVHASERELRQLVDSFPGMVAVASAEGRLQYANKRVVDYVGTGVADLADMGWLDVIHPDERVTVGAEWLCSVVTGRPMDLSNRWRRADGVYRWLHMRVEPLLDEHGRILRWYGLIVDIDERKNAEEALRRSEGELARISRIVTMGELTASIAHEVNQPLSAVANNADACLILISDAQPALGEIRDALAEIVDDAHRASAVIARVRQLASRAPLERALLDLRDVVADVLALARHQSDTRRVTLESELPQALPAVLGDRVQLQQVLLNLVVNAMDAASDVEEPRRIVTVRAHSRLREGMPEAVVAVQDAGVGVTADAMSRLFDAFYTTKPQGMGMGLAISRSIVEMHGGRLWVEPNQGPGTTFSFSVPAAAFDGAAS